MSVLVFGALPESWGKKTNKFRNEPKSGPELAHEPDALHIPKQDYLRQALGCGVGGFHHPTPIAGDAYQ